MRPSDLCERWRQQAAQLLDLKADGQAAAILRCASELQEAWTAWELEPLTLKEAEAESGYSYSALQHMVADGRIENVGTKQRPRIRRADLPRRPRRALDLSDEQPDVAAAVLIRRFAAP